MISDPTVITVKWGELYSTASRPPSCRSLGAPEYVAAELRARAGVYALQCRRAHQGAKRRRQPGCEPGQGDHDPRSDPGAPAGSSSIGECFFNEDEERRLKWLPPPRSGRPTAPSRIQ